MTLGERLLAYRNRVGLSQEKLAEKIGVTRQTVSKWELGQTTPEMDKLLEMSKIFGINVDDLLDETKEIKSQTEENKTNTRFR